MTENEAIKELKEDISLYDNEITRLDTSIGTPDRNLIDALEMAIQALEEIQQYRAIGTVDECREANGKQMPKKVKEDGYFGFIDYVCPTCGHDAGSSGTKYCKNCGQKLRWL